MTPAAPGDGLVRRGVALPHGITLQCRQHGGPDGPRVLLLHGFPEAAFIWDDVMRALGPAVHCTAPNLRGYGGSSAPAEVSAYRARHLVGDLAALIDALGGPVDLLVAHDWGGALAWLLAAQRPALMRRLLILNAPHHAAFRRELLHNPVQQQGSAYMHYLCRPDAAARLAEDDFRRLFGFFTAMGADDPSLPGGGWLTPTVRQSYREVWAMGLDGALNYYRASPLKPPLGPDDPLHTLALPPDANRVDVPTTVLWGEADTALPPALLEGLDTWVPGVDVRRVPGATHWLVHERPSLVVQTIRELLGG